MQFDVILRKNVRVFIPTRVWIIGDESTQAKDAVSKWTALLVHKLVWALRDSWTIAVWCHILPTRWQEKRGWESRILRGWLRQDSFRADHYNFKRAARSSQYGKCWSWIERGEDELVCAHILASAAPEWGRLSNRKHRGHRWSWKIFCISTIVH